MILQKERAQTKKQQKDQAREQCKIKKKKKMAGIQKTMYWN